MLLQRAAWKRTWGPLGKDTDVMVDAKLTVNQACVLITKLTAFWAELEGVWPAEQR